MTTTRRDFVKYSVAVGASAALGAIPARVALARGAGAAGNALSLLILGGTGFLGPAIVDAAVARGHKVTVFNRGRTEKRKKDLYEREVLPDGVERLMGNRDPQKHSVEEDTNTPKGLVQLEGDRTWDAVIDTSGYVPRIVNASAALLKDRVKHYSFISSVSAYAASAEPWGDESRPVAKLSDPTVESMGASFENYGGLKALCEEAAESVMPGRVANIRPGYIVGPWDPTDRFTYWPVRTDRGGEMVVPGAPDDPIQIIDVRDLGEWLVRLAEQRTVGIFNALGPATPLTMKQIVDASRAVSSNPANANWIPTEFLQQHAAGPGVFPIWLPPSGEFAGFHRWKCDRAVAAGLTFRSIADTVRATMDWWKTLPADRTSSFRPGVGVSAEKEAELLKLWRESNGKP